MNRRLQTWGLALVLGLALSAAFDVGHPQADKQGPAVADAASAPGL